METKTSFLTEAACSAFGVSKLTEERTQINTWVRIAIATALKPYYTTTAIGKELGRDHATILYYFKTHDGLMQFDKKYRSLHSNFLMNIGKYENKEHYAALLISKSFKAVSAELTTLGIVLADIVAIYQQTIIKDIP